MNFTLVLNDKNYKYNESTYDRNILWDRTIVNLHAILLESETIERTYTVTNELELRKRI